MAQAWSKRRGYLSVATTIDNIHNPFNAKTRNLALIEDDKKMYNSP